MPLFFNTSPGPVLVDSNGHTIDGASSAVLEETAQVIRAVIRGDLINLENFSYIPPTDPTSPSVTGGVITGGKTGQALIKKSNIDGDYKWATSNDVVKLAADYGALSTTSAATNNTTVLAAVRDRPSILTVMPPGDWPLSLEITDNTPLRLKGSFVQVAGTKTSSGDSASKAPKPVIYYSSTFGAPIAVSAVEAKVGPDLPIAGVTTQTITKITVPGNNYSRFKAGDVYQIHSNDYYNWSTAATGGNNVWKAAFVPVLGVGIDFNTISNGGPIESTVVHGATSNAQALVQGVVRDDDKTGGGSLGTGTFNTATLDTDFIVGENILDANNIVVGVVVNMHIQMFGRLIDSYTTNPVIRKVNKNASVDLDITVKAESSTDAFIASYNRTDAIDLRGIYNFKVKADIKSGFRRGIALWSCYNGNVDATVEGLPNHALENELSQGGYGYGVTTLGCSEFIQVKVRASNVRHAFSTNVSGSTYNLTAAGSVDSTGVNSTNYTSYGTSKFIKIYDSVSESTFGAGFDTHEGCYNLIFDNCESIRPYQGGRAITNGASFNNRGFGTIFRNCYAYDPYIGFSEGGNMLDSGFTYVTRYINCYALNFQYAGFAMGGNSTGGYARIELENCHMRGDGTTTNVPYFQYPYLFRNGYVTTNNCKATRFNGPPMMTTGGGRHHHSNFFADYFDATGTDGVRVESTLSEFTMIGLKVRQGNSSRPSRIFRNVAGDTNWQYDQVSVTASYTADGVTTVLPPLSTITAGSPVFTKLNQYAVSTGGYVPGTPTFTLDAHAGTGATATLSTNGDDSSGTVTVTTGTGTALGVLITVNYGNPYTVKAVPNVDFGQNLNTKSCYVSSYNNSGFTITVPSAPVASANSIFTYTVKGS